MKIFLGQKINSHNQTGFTLIETLVALAIVGVVSTAVLTASYQVQSISNIHYAHVTAVKQVENALHYINRDVQSAQTVSSNGSQGFPLVLTWVSWDTNATNTVTYTLQPDNHNPPVYYLQRQWQVNSNPPSSTVIAKPVDHNSANTFCNYSSAIHQLTIQLTSTVSRGGKQETETRLLSIVPRPGS